LFDAVDDENDGGGFDNDEETTMADVDLIDIFSEEQQQSLTGGVIQQTVAEVFILYWQE
jgi:hypothetical protein